MSERTCACGKPLHQQAEICRQCERHTRRRLGNQAAYLSMLETELARESVKSERNDGGKSAETPTPFLEAAANAIHHQRSLLVSWTRLLIEEGILADYPADTIPAMACAIEAQMGVMRRHEAASELVAEFRSLSDRIMRVVDLPEVRSRVKVGPCPQRYPDGPGGDDGWEIPCDGEVSAVFPAEAECYMRCSVCKANWSAEQWSHAGQLILRRKAELAKQAEMAKGWAS